METPKTTGMLQAKGLRRLVTIVLYVNIAFPLLGAFLFLTRQAPVAAAEPASSRQVAALLLGFAVTAWIVSRRFADDPTWLLVPIVMVGIDLVVTHIVSLASAVFHLGIPYDPGFPLPLVVDLIAVPIYLIYYLRATRR